ncbi:MAG: hypothetical protein PHY93_05270 [Bacteriovorax sp.]|nr:hypothetical protein [Bacteriovorax sp.]
MKKISLILPVFLSINCSLIFAADSFQILEENKRLTALKTERDPAKKEDLIKELGSKCPFNETNSQLAALIPSSTSLNLSANLSDQKRAECTTHLQGFNQSLDKTKGIQDMVADPSLKINDEQKKALEDNLKNAVSATSGLRSMLEAQCEFGNSSEEVSSISNNLINVVEGGSSALASINPIAGLIGAGAAATGRLVSSLGGWLFGKAKNELGREATDSDRFINDLCSFRNLAQKYDKLYTDPFEKSLNREKQLAERKNARDRASEATKNLQVCAEQLKSSVDKLQAFSLELTTSSDLPSSQRQCLSLLNKYIDTKKSEDADPLQVLASKYGCFTPEEDHSSYCNNLSAIESMTEGDIYNKCEKEDFQKAASAKFINLSDILFRSVQEDVIRISPITDELQRIRDAEENERIASEQFDAIQNLIDANPITNVNTSKSMTNLGRNLLGSRFDKFVKSSLKSASIDFEEASDVLDDLVDQKKELNEGSFFSWGKKDDSEKAKIQKEICDNASQVIRQLATAYRSNAGVKDICDFMKGDGVPSLKTEGFNYDSYSAAISDQSNNLSNRCNAIYKVVTTNFTEIKVQMNIATNLGCSK